MDIITNPQVTKIFDNYPDVIRPKMFSLRQLVLDTAAETKGINRIEETLKWGEPSYLVKGGSTIRMEWKVSSPNEYALYFHCQTRLVETFSELYSDRLSFQGKRAILLNIDEPIPKSEVKHCLFLALTYHNRKRLPMLGV